MTFTTCWVKNVSGDALDLRHFFDAGEEYQISDNIRSAWANDSAVDDAICGDLVQIGDGTQYFTDHDTQINYLKMIDAKDTEGHPIYHYTAFAEKKLPDGSKLYKRLHGVLQALTPGSNTITFVCPHSHVKMIGARIVNGEVGDYCDFKVLDDQYGSYLGTPNAVLNQYGFNVAIVRDNHEEVCKYDADLYYGMQIQFTYYSMSAKTLGVNFNLSEVVPQA